MSGRCDINGVGFEWAFVRRKHLHRREIGEPSNGERQQIEIPTDVDNHL